MKQKVKLSRLDSCLKEMPAYIAAMNRVTETAHNLGVADEALDQILEAYREVEQIRADFLCNIGIPVKEKFQIYGMAEDQEAAS